MTTKQRIIMGHRGAPSLAPENTLGGIRRAAEVGAQWVELDTTLLADDTAVVNHDATIDRCSDHNGTLAQMDLRDLERVNNAALYPEWPKEKVATLAETLRLIQQLGISLNLELKDHGQSKEKLVKSVFNAFRQTGFDFDKLVISSFSYEVLELCRAQSSEVRLGLLYQQVPMEWLSEAQQLNAWSLHCDWRHLSKHQLSQMKKAGYQVYCWTANDPEQIESLWSWGLDAVITDNPQDYQSQS